MEGMEDAEADCSAAFAEAQRWVEVSVFLQLFADEFVPSGLESFSDRAPRQSKLMSGGPS